MTNLLYFAAELAVCLHPYDSKMRLHLESFYLVHSMATNLSLVSFKSQMQVTSGCSCH